MTGKSAQQKITRTFHNRYHLTDRLGHGGCATVYRGWDEKLERTVAVKIMDRQIDGDPRQLERFHREARAVAKLSHPHIVTVIDAGEDQGHPYIVFECIEGETLKSKVCREGQLSISESIAYAIEIARALQIAHNHQIVHRDIKPQNVLINEEGSAKVTDFGIAWMPKQKDLTIEGQVLGSTYYISPEQALGKQVGPQSDLYSLGIVLFEMLTGHVPFTGNNQIAVAMRHVRERVPDVRSYRPEISASLASVVDSLTAREVERRYCDTAMAIAELERVLAIETTRSGNVSGEATAVLQTLPIETKRRIPLRLRHPIAVLLTILLAAACGMSVMLTVARNTQRGTGLRGEKAPPGLTEISLGQKAARDYDPIGDDREHPAEAAFVVDRDPQTTWSTEHYQGGLGDKEGVGIYVATPEQTHARMLEVQTPTPGWSATIYGAQSKPPNQISAPGWVRLAQKQRIQRKQDFKLRSNGEEFRYYLVWITKFPADVEQVSISEISLFK